MLLPLLEEDLEGGADGLAAFHLRARRQLEDRVVRVEGDQPLEVAAAEGGEVLPEGPPARRRGAGGAVGGRGGRGRRGGRGPGGEGGGGAAQRRPQAEDRLKPEP